ncbi:MAG: acyl carrier protein [Candidatus Omnitrophica bacterium]|nr:acyl carrier protein [Candidatus Omnitrophota bacterium]MDD5430428.1 acyl carrier protein [Candidatus Omnitrophota bacterium]
MALKDEVVEVICSTLEVKKEEIKDGQNLYDSIGVDSTEMVEVVVSLGKRFGIQIETSEITKFSTLEEIVSVIEKKKNAN